MICVAINVTNADLPQLGHGYVSDAREVLTDIHELIHRGTPPDKRFGLEPMKSADGAYWLIRA